jgi:hypothetical protein
MPEQPIEERVAQLERIVATQSEMILKLVELMNHLGSESAATNERMETSNRAVAEQFEKLRAPLERLLSQLGGEQRTDSLN